MPMIYLLDLNGAIRAAVDVINTAAFASRADATTTPPPDDALLPPAHYWAWGGAQWNATPATIDPGLSVVSLRPSAVVSAPIPETRASLLARLAAIRYVRETGGAEMAGAQILTGRTDQAMTTQAFVTLRDGLVDAIDWKGADGWHRVTLAELEPVARAVAAHVQRCFSAERAVAEQIAALPDDDIPAFDLAAAWDAAWSPV